MAAARMEVSLLMFFVIVLPLIFAFIVFVAAMTAIIITTRRRRKAQQNEFIPSDVYIPSSEEQSEEALQRSDDETPRTFAEILREHRTSRRFSQEYVAEQLDVTRQAVSKWENGTSEPSTANLIALAKLYGISLDELVKGTKS